MTRGISALLVQREPMVWTERGACREMPKDIFYDDSRVSEAREVCATCPVRQECLDWAVAHDEAYGVWGGKTVDERDTESRRRVKRFGTRRRSGLTLGERVAIARLKRAGYSVKDLKARYQVSGQAITYACKWANEQGLVEAV